MPTISAGLSCRPGTVTFRRRAVERVIGAMRQRLAEPLSHELLARIALMSPFHFNRVFREVTGVPPLHFLYSLRLQAAKRLLLTTRLSITDVCYEVGYNSLGTFISRFTRLVGQSPRHLRRLAERAALGGPGPIALADSCPAPHPHGPVSGRVVVPPPFRGAVFVGLFATPLPQGRPAACAVVTSGDKFRLGPVPEGAYYLFAAGLPASADPSLYLTGDAPLRGRSGPVVAAGGKLSAPADVTLRPEAVTDPPILSSIPLLLDEAGGKSKQEEDIGEGH
jgi:AraC-like DNA-binding protein